jgi:hypothetical protein
MMMFAKIAFLESFAPPPVPYGAFRIWGQAAGQNLLKNPDLRNGLMI